MSSGGTVPMVANTSSVWSTVCHEQSAAPGRVRPVRHGRAGSLLNGRSMRSAGATSANVLVTATTAIRSSPDATTTQGRSFRLRP